LFTFDLGISENSVGFLKRMIAMSAPRNTPGAVPALLDLPLAKRELHRQPGGVGRLKMTEFMAPLPVAAVALMALNDRVLKPRFHNGLTGKLSDIAICFFLPLFTSALLGLVWQRHARARVLVGAGIAAFAFTAQELWKSFQDGFIAALGVVGAPLGLRHFVLTSDASDLLALLMVPLAVAYGWKRLAATSAPTGSSRTSVSGSGLRKD
jgi:hypothetical protein